MADSSAISIKNPKKIYLIDIAEEAAISEIFNIFLAFHYVLSIMRLLLFLLSY